MSIVAVCPSCGFESPEMRCPRCNTLKLQGCNGTCSRCGNSCTTGSVPAPPAKLPSDAAAEDDEHPGTPLR
jgi:hypothetical protein